MRVRSPRVRSVTGRSLRRGVGPVLRLVRWANALTAAAGVIVGAWFTTWVGRQSTLAIAFATATAIALTAAANAWNDIADLDIDRVAHPGRPLVTGGLSVAAADRIAMTSATVAVLCASRVSVVLGLCTVGVLLLMRLYSPWVKRAGLAGNLVVALLASLPFVYGSYAAGLWERGVPLVLIAIPLHLARELAKDLDDRHADRGRRRTLPLTAGAPFARVAILLALVAAGAAFAFSLVPIVRAPVVLLAALLPAVLALALATVRALRGLPGSPAFFKIAMMCAMAALVVARA